MHRQAHPTAPGRATMGDVDLLGDLDPAQLAAVTHPDAPVCVLAPAGSGKTRVLTRRIAWRAQQGTLDVRRVLAITFTTRAAKELSGRLGALLGRDTGTTGTFHAVAWRMLRDHHRERGTSPPTILEGSADLLDELIPTRHRAAAAKIRAEVAWASARGVTPETYSNEVRAAERHVAVDPAVTAEVFAAYVVAKRRRGVVDFDDLIRSCAELAESDPTFSGVQRWRHRHFFVDEYQDVNPLQQRLLDAWLAGRDDLFVVGDPHQAIYGFNGADAGFLTGFTERYRHAGVVELSRNHRSTPELVRVAEAVLGRRGADPTGTATTSCTVTATADADAEALAIARRLRSEHAPGHRWSAQAVLVRTHAQTRPILDLLERSGIPVTTEDDPAGPDAVRVATYHSAKGLEWPVVHLAGVEEGYVPDHRARSDEAIGEERRVLYVATSRATRRLHLTWARRRVLGGRIVDRHPSRWLAPIERAIGSSSEPAPRRRPSPRLPPVRPDARPETARDRLIRWRTATARAASVPTAVVLPDQVLEDLVRLAPTDPDELGNVPGLGTIKADRYGAALLDALHPGRSR